MKAIVISYFLYNCCNCKHIANWFNNLFCRNSFCLLFTFVLATLRKYIYNVLYELKFIISHLSSVVRSLQFVYTVYIYNSYLGCDCKNRASNSHRLLLKETNQRVEEELYYIYIYIYLQFIVVALLYVRFETIYIYISVYLLQLYILLLHFTHLSTNLYNQYML